MKISVSEQVAIRSELYNIVCSALEEKGYATEPVVGGTLIHLPNGHYAMAKVSVKDDETFNVDEARKDYAAKQEAAAERARQKAERAAEKARKEQEKADKAKQKAEAEAEAAE